MFKLIEQLSTRLANTVIENQDFEVLIKHCDRENSFFYCDLPYFSSEYVYQCGFIWNYHLRLKEALSKAEGKWLVSVVIRREKICDNCIDIAEEYNKNISLEDFLDSLSEEEQRDALITVSLLWAEKQKVSV